MISRIRLGGYKSFEDAETRLGGLNVFLGPLGSGRSNFLEAIAALGRLAAVERLERAFLPPHRGRASESFRTGPLRLLAEIELNPRIVKALNARLAEREKLEELEGSYTRVAEKRLRYEIALELSPDSGAIRLLDESLEALTAEGAPRRGRRAFFERDVAHGRFLARIERQGRVRYFGAARRRSLLSEVTDLVYHPHPAATREEMLGIRRFALEPSALRQGSSGSPAEGPGFRGEELVAFVTRLALEEADTLRRIEERLAPVGLDRIDLVTPNGPILLSLRGDRVPLPLAPSGMLSLIAIAALLESASAPTIALLDEPENGLDPSGLNTLARLLRTAATGRRPATQIVVVTGSVELAMRLEPANVVACRRVPGKGTVFEPLAGDPEDLFRRAAMERALEGSEPRPAVSAPARTPAKRRKSRRTRP